MKGLISVFLLCLSIMACHGHKVVLHENTWKEGQFNALQFPFFNGITADTLRYQLYVPVGYKQGKFPLVTFLHGSGERGTDNQKQLVHIAPILVKNQGKNPAFLLFPQCKTDDYWATVDRKVSWALDSSAPPKPSEKGVMELVDLLQNHH